MGSATDKIKGVANEVGGKVKEGVGKAIGNEQMQVEGMAQQVKGKAQVKVGEAKSTIKDLADNVADKAHDKLERWSRLQRAPANMRGCPFCMRGRSATTNEPRACRKRH